MLEGVEMFDDDWSKIEEHVGTRSAQQCVRKFLELPIEDPYLNTEASMGPLRYGRVPFEHADNPVMSVVAFLAGVVGPGVAAEAAKTALHELTADGVESKEGAKEDKAAEQAEAKDKEVPQDDDSTAHDRMEEDAVKDEANASSGEAGTPAPTTTTTDGMAVDGLAASMKPKHTLPHSKVVRAADLALKSSAKAAKALADAEDTQIRSTLANLIKLALTKLELKTAQFEELEDILEEERRGLESARMALVNERLNLKKMLDNVRSEIAKHGVTSNGVASMVNAPGVMGTTGQGGMATEVQPGAMEGDMGPVSDGSTLQLT